MEGAARVEGGRCNDLVCGGFNAARFRFQAKHGVDTIGDCAATNDLEVIDLTQLTGITRADLQLGHSAAGRATQQGSDVWIDTGGGNRIVLTDVALSDLDAADFAF